MTTPLCCPSRSSILRGQYAHTTGVYTNAGDNGGADDFDRLGRRSARILQSAGYRTGFHGKYLNGYPQLWTDPSTPYVPPGWDDWRAFRQVQVLRLHPDRERRPGRRTAPPRPTTRPTCCARRPSSSSPTRSRSASRSSSISSFKAPHGPFDPAPRHVGMFAGLPPWRPASHNEPDVSDKPTWVQNTTPLRPTQVADLDDIRIAQLEMLQAVDEAIGGSTTYGITGIMQHLRNLGIADDTIVDLLRRQRLALGRAPLPGEEQALRGVDPLADVRPLSRSSRRCRASETRFALNIDFCPTFAELALRADRSACRRSPSTASAWCACSTAPRRPGAPTSSPRAGPASHVWASVREAQWKYTELPLTPGDPLTDLRVRALRPASTIRSSSNSLHNDPAQALRMAEHGGAPAPARGRCGRTTPTPRPRSPTTTNDATWGQGSGVGGRF